MAWLKLDSTKAKAEKLVAKPNFYNITPIDEELCIIQMEKKKPKKNPKKHTHTHLCFNKPICWYLYFRFK